MPSPKQRRPTIAAGLAAGFTDLATSAARDIGSSYHAILTQDTGWAVPEMTLDHTAPSVADTIALEVAGNSAGVALPDPEAFAAAVRVMRAKIMEADFTETPAPDRRLLESPVIDGDYTDITGQKRMPRQEPHVEPKTDIHGPDSGTPDIEGPDA